MFSSYLSHGRIKHPGFDKLLERFTKNQIEYIDNLSTIATAFSSFAKMPGQQSGGAESAGSDKNNPRAF